MAEAFEDLYSMVSSRGGHSFIRMIIRRVVGSSCCFFAKALAGSARKASTAAHHQTNQDEALKQEACSPDLRVLEPSIMLTSRRLNSLLAAPWPSGRPITPRSLEPSERTCFPSSLTNEGGNRAGSFCATCWQWSRGTHSPSSAPPIGHQDRRVTMNALVPG